MKPLRQNAARPMPTKGADFEARRRRFIALAGSCPILPDVPPHSAPDIPRDADVSAKSAAGGRNVFARIRAMRKRRSLGKGVSARDLINEGRRL